MEKIEEWLKDNHNGDGSGFGYGDGSGNGNGNGNGYGYGDGSGNGSGYVSGYVSGYGYGDGSGNGNGYGYGDGSGNGNGYGSGNGSGYVSGFGYGDGDGSGFGYGDGSGNGNGYGYGDGSGYVSGFGYGDGSGSGISFFNGEHVFRIDNVPTIIKIIKDNIASGFILNSDFTKTKCFVAKGNGFFAHGKSVKEAVTSLREKIYENMDSDEAIEKFIETFEPNKKYKGALFFEWHHYLTGSCLMGRESFVKNHGLSLESEYTVDEFISLCENNYGGEVIKELKGRWNDKKKQLAV